MFYLTDFCKSLFVALINRPIFKLRARQAILLFFRRLLLTWARDSVERSQVVRLCNWRFTLFIAQDRPIRKNFLVFQQTGSAMVLSFDDGSGCVASSRTGSCKIAALGS